MNMSEDTARNQTDDIYYCRVCNKIKLKSGEHCGQDMEKIGWQTAIRKGKDEE